MSEAISGSDFSRMSLRYSANLDGGRYSACLMKHFQAGTPREPLRTRAANNAG
jgi:hypothetical protein